MLVTSANCLPTWYITGSLTMAGPKINFSRLRPIARSLSPLATPGYSRDDRDLVLRLNLRTQPRTEPNVLVVQVHVHELTKLALLVEQAVLETGIARVQRLDGRGEVDRLDVDGGLAVRKTAQRTRDSKLWHQIFTFSRNDFSVGSISTRREWPLADSSTSAAFRPGPGAETATTPAPSPPPPPASLAHPPHVAPPARALNNASVRGSSPTPAD